MREFGSSRRRQSDHFITKFSGFEMELEVRVAVEFEGQATAGTCGRSWHFLSLREVGDGRYLSPEGDIVRGDREVASWFTANVQHRSRRAVST